MTRFSGFQERSIDNEKVTFDWSAENKIALNESYVYRGKDTGIGRNTPDGDCPDRGLDYLYVIEALNICVQALIIPLKTPELDRETARRRLSCLWQAHLRHLQDLACGRVYPVAAWGKEIGLSARRRHPFHRAA